MIEKKHSYFNRRLNTVMIAGIILAGLIVCNILEIFRPQIIPTNTGIYLVGVIIFSVLIYGFWVGSHVKCPECSTLCKRYSD
jgi:hypothetical protein